MSRGHTDESYGKTCVGRTAVTRGCDFIFNGLRYQIKANRPSGKPGSFVTLVGKASNYDWDRLIWLLYDRYFVLQEAWEWPKQIAKDYFVVRSHDLEALNAEIIALANAVRNFHAAHRYQKEHMGGSYRALLQEQTIRDALAQTNT
jgi:hypothetical protein